MGVNRKNFPHRRYVAGQASFKALRQPGPKLWPHPQKVAADKKPLPGELEALPGTIQRAVKNGVQQALRDRSNIGWVNLGALPPNVAAPFKNTPLNETIALIVGGAAANQQSVATDIQNALVGAANQVSGVAYPIVIANPSNGGGAQYAPASFRTYNPGIYQRAHVTGVEVSASSLDAFTNLLFSVRVDGLTVLDRVGADALSDLAIDCKPRGQIELAVASSDPAGVYLVFLKVKGWLYPVSGLGSEPSEALYPLDADGREAEDDGAFSDEEWLTSLAGSVNTGGTT